MVDILQRYMANARPDVRCSLSFWNMFLLSICCNGLCHGVNDVRPEVSCSLSILKYVLVCNCFYHVADVRPEVRSSLFFGEHVRFA